VSAGAVSGTGPSPHAIRAAAALALVALELAAGCSSSKRDSSPGVQRLEAVVTEREHEPPGTGGTSFREAGRWYLVLEAREGDATARYRFQVTQQQYQRFPEGSRVEIILADRNLRQIRPLPER